MPKQSIRVHIFNQTYSVLTDGDEGDVQAIAHEIDELMTSIAHRAASGDSTRIAVLACLHLADKLRNAQHHLKMAEQKLQSYHEKSDRIAGLLDAALTDGYGLPIPKVDGR